MINLHPITLPAGITCLRWMLEVDNDDANKLFHQLVASSLVPEDYFGDRLLTFSPFLSESSPLSILADSYPSHYSPNRSDTESERAPSPESEYRSSQDSTYTDSSEDFRDFDLLLEKVATKLSQGVSYKFATGTSGKYRENRIDLWSLFVKEKSPAAFQITPYYSITHPGDVNDLQFRDCDSIIAASNTGDISVYGVPDSSQSEKGPLLFRRYHAHKQFYGGCSRAKFNPHFYASLGDSLDLDSDSSTYGSRGSSILSSGYDGSLAYYDLEADKILSNRKGIAATIYDLVWFTPRLASLACSSGQMKLVDLRSPKVTSFALDAGQSSIVPPGDFLSISQHPTQPFIFATGTSTGGIAVMDLRYTAGASSSLLYLPSLHGKPVCNVQFSAANPDFLISASEDGLTMLSCWKTEDWGKYAKCASTLAQFRFSYLTNHSIQYQGAEIHGVFHTLAPASKASMLDPFFMDIHPVTGLLLSNPTSSVRLSYVIPPTKPDPRLDF